MKRLGILTGGGDAPGLNAVIRAVVLTASADYNMEVVGIPDGFDGLLDSDRARVLTPLDVRGILSRGGTILGAANRGNPFAKKTTSAGSETITDVSADALRNIERLKLDALLVLGGDGTLRISQDLFARGAPIVGVPKTIDNDMGGTDVTFGFNTAVATATEATDRLHSTAESHHRVMVLELMGREAGWISLVAGVAGGADVILIPEIEFDTAGLIAKLEERRSSGRLFSILAVAEGARSKNRAPVLRTAADALHVARLGGIGQQVSDLIETTSGLETRCTVLGHLQRGGTPVPFDRWLATRYGAAAVRLAAGHGFGRMVCYHHHAIGDITLADALAQTPKLVDPKSEMVQMARGVGISFGDSQ
ncbi:MAG: ATP-dependent 6-phosphofructokinase [Chloroflexi bacterium]|nr:MAG: ATP-dependent 6-phosphofructokinase [Chloroflexota bacterium]